MRRPNPQKGEKGESNDAGFNWKSVLQFAGGILCGVLITLSLVIKLSPPSSTPNTIGVQVNNSQQSSPTSLSTSSNNIATSTSSQNKIIDIRKPPMQARDSSTSSTLTSTSTSTFLAPPKSEDSATSKMTIASSSSSVTSTLPSSPSTASSSTAAKSTTTSKLQKSSWVPGKEGGFLRFKGKADDAAQEFVTSISTSSSLSSSSSSFQSSRANTAATDSTTSSSTSTSSTTSKSSKGLAGTDAASSSDAATSTATDSEGEDYIASIDEGSSGGDEKNSPGLQKGGAKLGLGRKSQRGGGGKKGPGKQSKKTAQRAAAAIAAATAADAKSKEPPPSDPASITSSEKNPPNKKTPVVEEPKVSTTSTSTSTSTSTALSSKDSKPSRKSSTTTGQELYDFKTGQLLDVSAFTSLSSSVISALPYPPLLPYHDQSKSLPLQPPYDPSLSSVTKQKQLLDAALASKDRLWPGTNIPIHPSVSPIVLPDLSLQKAPFEKDSLKLHLCNGVFEAYSASWLSTREHVLTVKSEGYNLSWVNCEMASFIHMRESPNFLINPDGHGMIIQSLDVLDFSVIHLSTFERSSKKYRARLWKDKNQMKTEWSKIDPVVETARILERLNNPAISGRNHTWSEDAKKTVVIMPFLGGAMGAGHSELGNRFQYLKACFWSFYEFIPNIVAGVSRQEDVDWAWKQSGLPFYDILLLPNLPKSAGLPVGTTQRTKAKLASGEWPFEYVFFTESDQILISRQLPLMYAHLKQYPQRMMLPHRLMVYSDRIMEEVHGKTIDKKPNEWMKQSCCLPRQNCGERKSWKGVADPSVAVINYYGLYVPLGNVNYLGEQYRACKIGPYEPNYCP